MIEDLHILWSSSGFLGRASLCVAAAAAIAHLSALAGAGADGPWAAFFALHLAVMVLGFSAVVRESIGRRRGTQAALSSATPGRLKWLTLIGGLYCMAWFLVVAYHGQGGAVVRNGTYAWVVHGSVVRSLTAAEYNTFQANIARSFSAAWFFAALSLALWHSRRDGGRAPASPTVLPDE